MSRKLICKILMKAGLVNAVNMLRHIGRLKGAAREASLTFAVFIPSAWVASLPPAPQTVCKYLHDGAPTFSQKPFQYFEEILIIAIKDVGF